MGLKYLTMFILSMQYMLCMAKGLRESSVAKAREPGLFGVELLGAMPEVSKVAQDSSLTSMVILIWPSALEGRPRWG